MNDDLSWWNEPFLDIDAPQDQRVREEGYVVLGQSLVSSQLLDTVLMTGLVLTLFACLVNINFPGNGYVPDVFASPGDYRLLIYAILIGLSVSRIHPQITAFWSTVRVVFASSTVVSLYSMFSYGTQKIIKNIVVISVVHASVLIGITAGPLLTHYLQKRYQRHGRLNKRKVARAQTDLLSDLFGLNVRRVPINSLGQTVRTGWIRMAGSIDATDISAFHRMIHNEQRARAAYLMFAPSTDTPIPKQKFLLTVSDIMTKWHALKQSEGRSAAVFTTLCGLADVYACMLMGFFVMAVFGFSIREMIATALFTYGIINGFLGEAIVQWKMGIVLVLGRHPYDINDLVMIPKVDANEVFQVIDYSLTSTLLRTQQGESVTVQHRDIADTVIVNLTRPPTRMVIITLDSSVANGDDQLVDRVRSILVRDRVGDYFRSDFSVSMAPGPTKHSLDPQPQLQFTYADGLDQRQRVTGLVKLCNSLHDASIKTREFLVQ